MGLIIEHYFEEKNIRFISLYDRVDTAKSKDNLSMAITNVMNSFYARQASAKTKAAHRSRAKDGMYLAGHALFGYVKDPNDRHKLIIDPPAADIVREVSKQSRLLQERLLAQAFRLARHFRALHPDESGLHRELRVRQDKGKRLLR
jgi:DNA invertase Pin-like site-specific DNA recombinase